MKKIGIITLYYNNDNYGGIAQSYALNRYIEKLGFDSELISYKRSPVHIPNLRERIKKEGFFAVIRSKLELFPSKLYLKISTKYAVNKYGSELESKLNIRRAAFQRSRELPKHSEVYTEETISGCIGKYDCYVSGSDQIWKPGVLQPPYVFEFLPIEYKRISYASSITVTDYPLQYGNYMKKCLAPYSWISVRETSAKNYLEKLLDKSVDVVVDPTLLLDEDEWNNLANERIVEDHYNDSYMRMFLQDYCLRPSCYECAAKKVKMSDLTIADFWGINNIAPYMDDGLGTSLVLIRTTKGNKLFESANRNMKMKEVSYEDGVKGNPAEYKSCARPSQRDKFFEDMRTMGFDDLKEKYAVPIRYSLKIRVKRKIKTTVKRILRVIGGGQRVGNADDGLLFVFSCEE